MGEKRVTMNVIKRYISVLLVAALVVTAIQVPTFAASADETINMVVGDTITLEAPTAGETTTDKPVVTPTTTTDKPVVTPTTPATTTETPTVTPGETTSSTPSNPTTADVATAPADKWVVDGDAIKYVEKENSLVVTAVKAGEATVTATVGDVVKVWNIVVSEKTTTTEKPEVTTTPVVPTTTPEKPVVTTTPGVPTTTPSQPTAIPTVTGTVSPTVTVTGTVTPTATPTGTITGTVTPTPTGTPVVTTTPDKPVVTTTPDKPVTTPTATPTGTVTVTVTVTPTVAPTVTGTVAPTKAPTVTPTKTPAYGKVKSVKLNAKKITLAKKASITLTATVKTTKKAYNKKVVWSTSNKKVATVKNGKVVAKKAGKAVIMAKADGKTAKCTITVSSKPSYKVTYKLNKGKNNGLNPSYVAKNTKTKLYAPTRKGYTFSGWYVGKKKVTSIKTAKKITVTAKWTKVKVKQTKLTKATGASKKFTVKFAKVKGAAGYEVTYSTNKKFKKAVTKTATVKKTTATVKKLKKGTYYVKVRAFKKDSTGKNVYSKYTAVKKVKVK